MVATNGIKMVGLRKLCKAIVIRKAIVMLDFTGCSTGGYCLICCCSSACGIIVLSFQFIVSLFASVTLLNDMIAARVAPFSLFEHFRS